MSMPSTHPNNVSIFLRFINMSHLPRFVLVCSELARNISGQFKTALDLILFTGYQ